MSNIEVDYRLKITEAVNHAEAVLVQIHNGNEVEKSIIKMAIDELRMAGEYAKELPNVNAEINILKEKMDALILEFNKRQHWYKFWNWFKFFNKEK